MSDNNNKSITYSSTRGSKSQTNVSFRQVVMQGLAHDRGLFVPDTFPTITQSQIEQWRSLSFSDLAVQIMHLFVKEDQIPYKELERIVHASYQSFRTGKDLVTPLVEVNGHFILELFHGPTFAFKDVALQMLGNIFEYFLSTGSNEGRLAVLGATSGDTGSAAIYGLRGKKGIDCVILYPNNRVSEIQERQMTTVPDSNIHCVAIEDGTFDDCQDLVKSCFADEKFRNEVKLGAVNSINWCRVMAQTTYYFWSYLRVTDKYPGVTDKDPEKIPKVNFSVPTGNFGDILAGYYAKKMGLPVDKLIVATNENDILHRFFTRGEYHRYAINKSISPSMDICVSSNFERYLYHLADDDPQTLSNWMSAFEATGKLTITGKKLQEAQQDFLSARADTNMTLETIRTYYDENQYMLCPHSAVGVSAIHQLDKVSTSTVALATAHEGKFPVACSMAVDPLPPPPKELQELGALETRSTRCANDLKLVQKFVQKRVMERLDREQEDGVEGKTVDSLEKEEEKKKLDSNVIMFSIIGVVITALVFLLRSKKRK